MNDHGQEQEPLDERLVTLARNWHEPPEAPREEMWQAIARARQVKQDAPRTLAFVSRPAFRLGAGIAALLVLGIGIGRFTAPGADGAAPAGAPTQVAGRATTSPAPAYQLAAEQHLEQSELYLTLFRASVRSGNTGEIGTGTARELLMSNRLLLDSPASQDLRVRRLLEDLELVLAQIAQLPADGRGDDAGYITDGMEAGSVLPRLRSVTSDGVAATLRQGAL
jgi:hypothetical protein